MTEAVRSAWATDRVLGAPPVGRLLFGEMHEDHRIETSVFRPGSNAFCIASAGCVAMRLAARGVTVVAADVNPAQVDYVRSRLRGGAMREGAADRLLRRLRALRPLIGWRPADVDRFCDLDDRAAQVWFWRERLDTMRFRLAVDLALTPLPLRVAYGGRFVGVRPTAFGAVLRSRLERAWSLHPNRGNPFVARLLRGDPLPEPPRAVGSVDVLVADAAAFLEGCEPHSFDGFALSNILDGVAPAYGPRLVRAVRRTARPGANLVLRSFREPRSRDEARWAARDRSAVWGRIVVRRMG